MSDLKPMSEVREPGRAGDAPQPGPDERRQHQMRSRTRLVLVAIGAMLVTLALTELRTHLTGNEDGGTAALRGKGHARSETGPIGTVPPSVVVDAEGRLHYDPHSPQLERLKIEAIQESPLPATGQMPGRLVYDENVTARVFSPISGRVTNVIAEAGMQVKAGDVLATIDSPDLGAVQSDLAKAQADEHQKRATLDRMRELFRGEVAPRKDLEAAQAEYDRALAETRRARQRSDNLRAQRDGHGQFSLRTPVDGVVVDRSINPGLEVRPDNPSPLFTVTDPTRVWLQLDVPERLLSAIHVDQPVQFEVNAFPDVQFRGRTTVVGVALDPATHRVQVRASAVDPQRRLRPEMFVRATFLVDDAQRGLAVPDTALLIDGQNQYVFVETSRGVFERRRVEPGPSTGRVTFLRSGIAPDERVVVEGALLLSAEVSINAR